MTTFVGIQTGETVQEKTAVLRGTAILNPGDASLAILIPTNIQAALGRNLIIAWETEFDEQAEPGVLPPPPGLPLHAPTHLPGGSDEVDGDQLDIDFSPSSYTPDTTPTEATNVDHLTAHLAGIDNGIDDNKMRAWYYR